MNSPYRLNDYVRRPRYYTCPVPTGANGFPNVTALISQLVNEYERIVSIYPTMCGDRLEALIERVQPQPEFVLKEFPSPSGKGKWVLNEAGHYELHNDNEETP